MKAFKPDPKHRLPDRRMVLGGLVASGVAAPAIASQPASIPPERWLAYEQRLTARVADGRFDERAARGLLTLTNAERAKAGAVACIWDPDLAETARAHAADLAARNYVAHLAPEGFDPSHRLAILARRRIGSASENIAYRRAEQVSTAEDLMGVWRSSPPHWSNLLKASHRRIGYGVAVKDDRAYAVGMYGHLDGELPSPLPFRLTDETALAVAARQAPPQIEGFELTDPVNGARLGGIDADFVPVLASGVYQLSPRSWINEGVVAVLWGPIFVKM